MQPDPSSDEPQERERTLREASRIVASADRPLESKVDALFELVRGTLGTDFATLSRVHEDADEYVFERVAAPPSVDLQPGDRTALGSLPNCERVVESRESLVLADVAEQAPALADPEWGIACYLGTPVVVDGEIYGTFCFYDREARSTAFSAWEVTLVDLLGDLVSREIERRRRLDRLTALNELNCTVRSVARVVIDRSTRGAIETATCETLAGADSYEFAWIGEADPESGVLSVRTAAGADDVLGGVDLSVTGETPLSPPARTLRSGDVETRRNLSVDAAAPAWRDHAAAFGYEASVSVPVVQGETVTEVLTVHASRSGAFADEEGATMAYLGELLGYAIADAERRRALTADALVELTVSVTDALAVRGIEDPPDVTVLLHELVAVEDGAVVAFGTATGAAFSRVVALGERLPNCETVTEVAARDGDVAFEARFSEMPVVPRVAALGGIVDQMLLDGGDLRMTTQFPPDVDVRRVLDVIGEHYPGADLVSKREIIGRDESRRADRYLTTELTDRQLEVLRTAYFAGYFERPRDATGQDVADCLGISNATVSQHLRTAEDKVLAALFDDEPDA